MDDGSGARPDASANSRAGSTRFTVTVPTELLEQVRAANPDFSPSAVLREGMRSMTGCSHQELACAHCGARVRRGDVIDQPLTHFYLETQAAVNDAARKGGTVEGLGRILKQLGISFGLKAAEDTPITRLTRAERQAIQPLKSVIKGEAK